MPVTMMDTLLAGDTCIRLTCIRWPTAWPVYIDAVYRAKRQGFYFCFLN